jgi:hypothetical protein
VGNPSAIVATRELVDIPISGNANSCANILFQSFCTHPEAKRYLPHKVWKLRAV